MHIGPSLQFALVSMGMTGVKEMQADMMTQSWAIQFCIKHLASREFDLIWSEDKFVKRVLCTYSDFRWCQIVSWRNGVQVSTAYLLHGFYSSHRQVQDIICWWVKEQLPPTEKIQAGRGKNKPELVYCSGQSLEPSGVCVCVTG